MTASALPINNLINVSVNLGTTPASQQNTSTLLILGSSAVIDVVERLRNYTTIAAVAADFGTSAPEYLAALVYFEQSPQPITLSIGRWAAAATAAVLKCGALSAAQQLLSAWTAITTGSFKITVNGTLCTVTGLTFAAQTNMNGVASVIQTGLNTTLAGTTCVWNSVYSRFEITSPTTGATSTVTFLTAAGSGTDISAMMNGQSTLGGYAAQGQALETAITAVTLFDNNYGQAWYALTVLGGASADYLAIAAYVEAGANRHIHGVTTQDANSLVAAATTDIGYQLQQLGYRHTVVQYSSSNPYAVCSLFGRILTVNYQANNTVITLMYKQEPGITPETLNATQLTAATGKNINVFVSYNNNTAIIQNGVACSGDFLDIITGTDWLALDIQTTVYNLLYTSTTKIPQTDAGNQQIVTAIEGECARGVVNGLLAPGVWQQQGFGALNNGDFMPKGFYVYAPPIASQNPTTRAARASVPIQVAAKMAGAIHTVSVIINVNR